MTVYRVTNPRQSWYGESIGILILDAAYPCVPGNVGNASTFPFPVRYKVVDNASIERLLKKGDTTLIDPFVEAALELQSDGVKAITGACGFMALFQREVAAAVDVPVFLSSLLQIPFIYQMLGRKKSIGVVSADRSCLTPGHFDAVGVCPDVPLVICGMEGQHEFRTAILEEKGTLDSDKIERELTGVVERMIADHPEIGAILLECSDLPPYAHAVQKITGLPVFDFITMIRHVHQALVQKPYSGCM